MDPALFAGAEYSTATDLFSFAGVMLYQLTLRHPVPGSLAPKIQGELIDAGFQSVAQLIAYSLSPDPALRPKLGGAADLLAKAIALMQPTPRRVATPIEIKRSPGNVVTVPAPLPEPKLEPEPDKALRALAAGVVLPLIVAGTLTVLIVLLLRSLIA